MFEGRDEWIATASVVLVVLGVVAGGSGIVGAVTAPATTDVASPADAATLTVDDDGDADYATIGAALAAAGDGDRVVVRPGTYEESLRIDGAVAVVAPEGATLSGTALDPNATAIRVAGGADVSPRIAGLTIAGYHTAVDATGTDGEWTLEDVRIRNVTYGVTASRTTGDWELRDVYVRDAEYGIYSRGAAGDWRAESLRVADGSTGVFAGSATGNWTVADSTFRNLSAAGVYANSIGGRWSVRSSTFASVPFGVYAPGAAGDWSVRDSSFRDGRIAVFAPETPGDWTVGNATVEDHAGAAVHAENATGNWRVVQSRFDGVTTAPRGSHPWDGVGIYAANATGEWAVRWNAVADVARYGVVATGEGDGDATRNWWAKTIPTADRCLGDVDCSSPLDDPPSEGDGPDVRRAAPREITAGDAGNVTLSIVFANDRERVSVFEAYRGPVSSASIESIRIGDDPAGDRVTFRRAGTDDLTIALTDVPAGRTVTVVYSLAVAANASSSDPVRIAGDPDRPDVVSGNLSADFGTDCVEVDDPAIADEPPGCDRAVTDADLENALVAWSSGELTTAELRAIVVEWSRTSG